MIDPVRYFLSAILSCTTTGSLITILLVGTTFVSAQTPVTQSPIPDLQLQKPVLDAMRATYGSQYARCETLEQKCRLAKQMLADAEALKRDTVRYYVLLDLTQKIAAQVHDAETATGAADRLADAYEVDKHAQRTICLRLLGQAASAIEDWQAISDLATRLSREAASAGNNTAAKTFQQMAIVAIGKASDPALPQRSPTSMVATNALNGSAPAGDYALEFDGNGYLSLPVVYDGKHPITIEARVTPAYVGGLHSVLTNYENAGLGLSLRTNSRWYFRCFGKDERAEAVSREIAEADKEVHIAGVFDGKQAKLFLDGALQQAVLINGPHRASKLALATGCEPNWHAKRRQFQFIQGFIGLIDEVRISKTARYSSNFTPAKRFNSDEHTIALYHFDEGQGTTAHDSSGNGNDAEIVDAHWVDSSAIGSSSDAPQSIPDLALFNGKNLDGWVVEGASEYADGNRKLPLWSVQDEMIFNAGKAYGFLRYESAFADAIFHIEYRMAPGGNSGIGIRGVPYRGTNATRPSLAGFEVQLLDDTGKPPTKHSTGSLYRYVAPATNAARPAGQWNTMEITLRGPMIQVTLNGQLI